LKIIWFYTEECAWMPPFSTYQCHSDVWNKLILHPKFSLFFKLIDGCAIAQVVSRQLHIKAAWGWSQIRLCGICGWRVALEQVFSMCLGFTHQYSFRTLLHIH
jgi:hypothetical protein